MFSFSHCSLPSHPEEASQGYNGVELHGCARLVCCDGVWPTSQLIVPDGLRELGTNHSGYKKVHTCIFLSTHSQEKCQEQIKTFLTIPELPDETKILVPPKAAMVAKQSLALSDTKNYHILIALSNFHSHSQHSIGPQWARAFRSYLKRAFI